MVQARFTTRCENPHPAARQRSRLWNKRTQRGEALVPATWNHSGGSLKKYRTSYAPPRRGCSMRIRRNRICNAIALALYSDSIINPPCTEHWIRSCYAISDPRGPTRSALDSFLPAQYSLIKRAGSPPPQIPERDCFVFVRDHATLPSAKLIEDEKINRGPTDRPRHYSLQQMAVTERLWSKPR